MLASSAMTAGAYAADAGAAGAETEARTDGGGTLIAVLDGGFNVNNKSFALSGRSAPALTKAQADAAAQKTAAYKSMKVKSSLYRSDKVPFAFDYGDGDKGVVSAAGEGTLAAGAAAANGISGDVAVYGAAPDAQLALMKITDKNGAVSASAAAGAIYDAIALGADCIALTCESADALAGDAEFIAACAAAAKAGVPIFAGAGDKKFVGVESSYDYAYGIANPLAKNPDYGVISPLCNIGGIYLTACSDAGTSGYFELLIDGVKYLCADTNALYGVTGGRSFAAYMGGSEYEYIYIGGIGEAKDYEGVDVAGRIAVVNRGEITFVDKTVFAAEAGAVALVVVDVSSEGSYPVNMILAGAAIPAVSVTKETGEALSGGGVMTALTPNDGDDILTNAYTCGVDASLGSAVTLTAAAGGITVPSGSDGYANVSGSRYAAAVAAGEYCTAKAQLSARGVADAGAAALRALCSSSAKAVVMYADKAADGASAEGEPSDAQDVISGEGGDADVPDAPDSDVNDNGIETIAGRSDRYTPGPRYQGAGVADGKIAGGVNAVLTGADGAVSTALGEVDPRRFTVPFEITNISDKTLVYRVSLQVMTDSYAVFGRDELLDYESSLYKTSGMFMDELIGIDTSEPFVFTLAKPLAIDDAEVYAFDYIDNYNASTGKTLKITLKPGATAGGTFRISIPESTVETLDEVFPNGWYIDGYVVAVGDGGDTLSTPFCGFAGKWAAADSVDGFVNSGTAPFYPTNQLCTYNDNPYSFSAAALGTNAYGYSSGRYEYFAELAAISPVFWSEGELRMCVSPLRDVTSAVAVIYDSDGNAVHTEKLGAIPKAVADGGGVRVTDVRLWTGRYDDNYLLALPDGDYTVKIEFRSAYGAFGTHTDTFVFGFAVDTVKPAVAEYKLRDGEDGEKLLDVTVSDDRYIQLVNVYDRDGDYDPLPEYKGLFEPAAAVKAGAGKATTLTYDISDADGIVVYIDVIDYAGNMATERVLLVDPTAAVG